tara:strand:- start:3387 stop:6851 length:3465 start_codon:yes stop_codon:yes gene_type:complete
MTDSNNYLRQLSALEEEETSSVSSSNLDRVDTNNLSKQLDEIESNTTFLNDATPDNTPATAVDEIVVTDVPEIDESPEAFYIRTGKVPVGYKYVPSVPVSDDPNDPANVKLVLDFDQPTVEEQTDKLFGYEDKKEIDKLLSEADIIDAQDFVDKAPTGLKTIAKVIAATGNAGLETLISAVAGIEETAKDSGEAITRAIHETFTEDNKLFGMTGKEMLPFDPKTAGKKFAGDLGALLEMAEAVPAVGSTFGLAGNTSKRTLKELKKEIKSEQALQKYLNRKLNAKQAMINTDADIDAKAELASKVASENRDIASDLIDSFENKTGKIISDTGEDGLKVINESKTREAGVETAEEIVTASRKGVKNFLLGSADIDADAALLAGQGDTLTQPLLKPEKFDALVAAVADLKELKPTAFDNNKTVIDNLFELTLNKELVKGEELIDLLNKYNLSFEDYILTVVGSGSEAGKTLQKLSQIKRMRPANEMIALQEAATKEAQGAIRKFIMRTENVRRAGLVSQVATAARNLTSGGIRAPLEGLGNVMDTALYNLSEEGYRAAGKSLFSGSNWKDSFRHMKYMFGPETSMDVKEYVDFILKQDGLEKQYDLMFNNINEIQKMTGRGTGSRTDKVLTELEDAMDVLNTPNRWQEHLIRRGAFLGELERLVKREYKIDLIDTINKGKIRDLLNDAGTVKPKDARSFNDIIAEATTKALDVTYAKAPDVEIFRATSQFIVRNGLTVALPFPRFMFNSMELMGQYAAGASIPLTKRLISLLGRGEIKKYTFKDRQRISRNLIGLATVGAAYQYRTMDDAPSDYKMLVTGDNSEIDTTPQYPVRQFLWMGEAMKRLINGTYGDWYDDREMRETFLGTNVRTGVGNTLIDEVVDIASTKDLVGDEVLGRRTGRLLGNYLSTWAVPYGQVIEAERSFGMRPTDFKERGKDPTLDFQSAFFGELGKSFGRFESPSREFQRPSKEFLFAERKERVAPILRVLGGLNITTRDEPFGEYIASFGFTEYELSSKSRVPGIKTFENKVVRDALPMIVEEAQDYEDALRSQYQISSDELKQEYSEEAYVSMKIRNFLDKQIKTVRSQVSDEKVFFADAPAYADAMLKYRRLPSGIREESQLEFFKRYNKVPDSMDFKDLSILVDIGKVLEDVYTE